MENITTGDKIEEKKVTVKVTGPGKKKPKKKKKRNVGVGQGVGGGRPVTWTDPNVLQKLVDNYFESEKQPTLAGLAVALDISRATLYNYAEKDKFLDIIKKAREKVERIYEKLLIYEGQPTGVIFALKNMGWADSGKIDHSSLGEKINIGVVSYDKVKKDAKSNDSA